MSRGCLAIANGYTIERIDTEEGLASLKPSWNRLYNAAVPGNPFLSFDWTLAWWERLCPPSSPFVLAAWQGSTLIGLAPLRIEKKWGLRLLKFMQDGRADYLGFLVSPEHPRVSELFLDYLYQQKRDWDLLLASQLCQPFFGPAALATNKDFRRLERIATVAPYLASKDDWGDLSRTGPPQLRRTRRKAKKLSREGGVIERLTGPETAGAAELISQVEAKSWKAGTAAAKFQTPNERSFLEQVLETLGQRGEVEVWMAMIDGVPIAYLLNFLSDERTFYYQGAYDTNYGKYSPGSVLHYCAVRRSWLEGPREYDFMMGDESWKLTWTNQSRNIKHVSIFPRSLRGYFAFGVLLFPRWYLRKFRYVRAVYDYWRRVSCNLSWRLRLAREP
jgi:CelD/BcsL family acetyltransferase involved in cellulose biosynthesis